MIGFVTANAQALLNLSVVVTNLEIDKELHETHATLDQAAGNKAAAGVADGAGENWRWTVVNAGIQNGTPSQYILLLRRFLPLIEPAIVLTKGFPPW